MKAIIPILCNLILIISNFAYAQHIKRQGNLGVQLASAPSNEINAVFTIAQVFPNSTASNAGLNQNDFLISINGIKSKSFENVKAAIAKFKADEIATIEIFRENRKTLLKGKIMPVPVQPPYPNTEIILEEVAFKSGYIRSIINKPKGNGPFKTIYYLQGYPCQSVHYSKQHPTTQFIDQLVSLGYVVYRIEKPGVGEFTNCKPCIEQSFEDEVLAFTNGLHQLRSLDFVNSNEIYLFGHSLGGNVAPLLEANHDVAGIMVYGTVVKPWSDYLIDMARYTQPRLDNSLDDIEINIGKLKLILSKLYEQNVAISNLSDEEKALLSYYYKLEEDNYLFDREIKFWKSLNTIDFTSVWSEVDVPVLSLYGSSDIHAISSLDAEYIATLVNQQNQNLAQFKLVEKTNHVFAKVESKAEEIQHLKQGTSGQVASTKFNTEIPLIIHHWISKTKDFSDKPSFQNETSKIPEEATSMSTMDVESADLNNDGLKDIIIATEFGPNRIFINTGKNFELADTTFLPPLKSYQPPYLGEDSEDIALGDFNKDGFIDLLFVSEDTENHELYFNLGDGKFKIHDFQIPKIGQANAVLVHDFNSDSFPDILIGIRGKNELYINKKGETFELTNNLFDSENTDSTQDLILVDIDNDGDLDVAEGIESGGNNLYIYDNGIFREVSEHLPDMSNIETRKVVSVDIDGDGDMDLYYCNVGWSGKPAQNKLLLNDGNGNYIDATYALPEDNSTTLDAVFFDINKDGKLDILTTGIGDLYNLKLFLNSSKSDILKFEENKSLIPKLYYSGGTSLIMDDFMNNGKLGIYLGNHKQKDIFINEI